MFLLIRKEEVKRLVHKSRTKIDFELSGELATKKKNRFTYKIKSLIHHKVDKIVLKKVITLEEIEKIAIDTYESSKFKIYKSIDDVFEDVNIDITKKEK